jgi:hypothetical protein
LVRFEEGPAIGRKEVHEAEKALLAFPQSHHLPDPRSSSMTWEWSVGSPTCSPSLRPAPPRNRSPHSPPLFESGNQAPARATPRRKPR